MKMRSNTQGILFVLAAGTCWGIIGIFTRYLASAGLSPMQTAFVRSCVAAVFMLVYILIADRSLLKIHIRDIWMFIGTGVASLALFNTFYFSTQQTTTLSVAAMLLYTAPVFVMLMAAVFFGERITRHKIIALAIAVLGCVFVTGVTDSAGDVPPMSVLTGVLSGFCYALYSIFGTYALKKYDTRTITFYTFLFSVIALCPFSNLWYLPAVIGPNADVIAMTVLLGVVCTAVPYLLYTYGLERTEASKASIVAFIEPVVATVTGIVVFRENITAFGICGMAMIFVSIIILAKRNRV